MSTAFRPPIQNDDGAWLCTVKANCSGVAVEQVSIACKGCEPTKAEVAARLTAKRNEADAHRVAVEEIRSGFEAEDREPTAAERVAGRAAHDQAERSAGELEELTAAMDAVLAEHTHAVMACEQHQKALPREDGN